MRRFLLSFLLAATILAAPVAFAAEAPKSAFTSAQKVELDVLMKQYIADHPETLISSVQTFYSKQTETKKSQEGDLTDIPTGLYDGPSVGPKDAKGKIVEFFDYNCGYCKQVAIDFDRLVDERKSDAQFIFKELPILSATSEVASRYALAADKQGKYIAFHRAVMAHHGAIDEDYLASEAKNVGLDVEKLKKDADGQDVRDALQKNLDLARELGVRGTPFFVIGKEKIPGAVSYTLLKDKLNAAAGLSAPTPSAAATAAGAAAEADTPIAPVEPTDVVPGGNEAAAANRDAANDEVNDEIAKAHSETQQMIEDLKTQAAALQQQAQAAQQAAEAAQKDQAARKAATSTK